MVARPPVHLLQVQEQCLTVGKVAGQEDGVGVQFLRLQQLVAEGWRPLFEGDDRHRLDPQDAQLAVQLVTEPRGVVILGMEHHDGLGSRLLHQEAGIGWTLLGVRGADAEERLALERGVGRRRRHHHHGHAEVLECLQGGLGLAGVVVAHHANDLVALPDGIHDLLGDRGGGVAVGGVVGLADGQAVTGRALGWPPRWTPTRAVWRRRPHRLRRRPGCRCAARRRRWQPRPCRRRRRPGTVRRPRREQLQELRVTLTGKPW